MNKVSKAMLSKNIEEKLDDFFNDNEPQNTPDNDQTAGRPLEKLKSMVLSIDWEITDECLTGMIAETDNLILKYRADRPANALLRMLKALGNYIRKHKVQAHQEAIKHVMSVFSSLEAIIEKHPDDDAQNKRIVISEIKSFNQLKQQIEEKRQGAKATPAGSYSPEAGSGQQTGEQKVGSQDLNIALLALEARINDQIQQLKSQLVGIKTELSNHIEK